jgi:hypothetical protein
VSPLAAPSGTKFYAPLDARYVFVDFSDTVIREQFVVHRGMSEGNSRTVISSFGSITVAWSADYVTVTTTGTISFSLYYYT